MFTTRPLNRQSQEEINSVAQNMKKTLMEVMGEEKGSQYYSMDWLLERVYWHIELGDRAKIILCEDAFSNLIGQAIVRVEFDEDLEQEIGYFSTIYIEPAIRKQGAASLLINQVHEWCKEKQLQIVSYSTAKDNEKLLSLFHKFGYEKTLKTDEMVKLECVLN